MDLYRLAWCSCAPNVPWIVDDQSCGSDAGVFGESEGSILKLVCCPFGCFPKIGVPQNGWFMMENPIKVDALGVPLYLETPISFGSFCFFFIHHHSIPGF